MYDIRRIPERCVKGDAERSRINTFAAAAEIRSIIRNNRPNHRVSSSRNIRNALARSARASISFQSTTSISRKCNVAMYNSARRCFKARYMSIYIVHARVLTIIVRKIFYIISARLYRYANVTMSSGLFYSVRFRYTRQIFSS